MNVPVSVVAASLVCHTKLVTVPTQILTEEITPTLSKLKEERSQYLEYQKVQRELEHLTKLYVAHRFLQAEVSRDVPDSDFAGYRISGNCSVSVTGYPVYAEYRISNHKR